MKLKQSHMSKMYEHNSFGTFDVDKAIDRQKILEKERKREREREKKRCRQRVKVKRDKK